MNKDKESQVFEEYVYDVLDKEIGFEIKHYRNKHSQIFIGENRQGIEVKYQKDFLTKWKGWLYFETMARRNWRTDGEWVHAGIFRHLQIPNDNTLWLATGNEELFYLFEKVVLQDLHNSNQYPVKEIEGRTSIGLALPPSILQETCTVKFVKGKAVLMNRPKNPDVKIIYREIKEEDKSA